MPGLQSQAKYTYEDMQYICRCLYIFNRVQICICICIYNYIYIAYSMYVFDLLCGPLVSISSYKHMYMYIYIYIYFAFLKYTANDLYIPISWPANLRHHVLLYIVVRPISPSFGSWFMPNALSSWDHQPSRSSYRLPHWARGNCLSRYWHCKNTTNRTYRQA